METTFGEHVNNYFESLGGQAKRVWKDIMIGNSKHCKKLKEILATRVVLVNEDDDSIF